MRATLVVYLISTAACSASTPGGAALTFDPCEPVAVAAPGATAEQLASIADAFALWRSDGVTSFTLADTAPISIAFRSAAPAMYGYYDDTSATVYINTELADPAQRAITIAHELGHALGLVHVAAATRTSVMNPGNLSVAPNDGDLAALARVWGACSAP